MTKAEERMVLKLQIENKSLRDQNEKHLDVYRTNIIELIELRARNDYINQILTEVLRDVSL